MLENNRLPTPPPESGGGRPAVNGKRRGHRPAPHGHRGRPGGVPLCRMCFSPNVVCRGCGGPAGGDGVAGGGMGGGGGGARTGGHPVFERMAPNSARPNIVQFPGLREIAVLCNIHLYILSIAYTLIDISYICIYNHAFFTQFLGGLGGVFNKFLRI